MLTESGCRAGSVVLGMLLVASSLPAMAEDTDARAQLAEQFPGVSVDDVKDSPIPGIYEVAVGAQVAYITADAKFLLRGDLYDLDTNMRSDFALADLF
ncbi:MAG: disulfide isomerase DsbC N-terminal domain-containing protein, partial [Gammaproteobacteria bacterium]